MNNDWFNERTSNQDTLFNKFIAILNDRHIIDGWYFSDTWVRADQLYLLLTKDDKYSYYDIDYCDYEIQIENHSDLTNNIERIKPGDIIFFASSREVNSENPGHVSVVYSVDRDKGEVRYCQYNEVKGPDDDDNYLSRKIGKAGNNYIRILHISFLIDKGETY